VQFTPWPCSNQDLTLKVADLWEVKRWLIGFGAEAEVLARDELCEEFATECAKVGQRGNAHPDR
jgi:predicted DNA-binding transcriptional regulator YafY